MRMTLFLVIGALALVFGPTEGLTQVGPPGGGGGAPGGAPPGSGGFGGGRGGMGGGGMGQFDPNQFFNQMSGGKDVWVRPDDSNQFGQAMFDRTAQRLGVTNGQISRQQFVESAQQRMAQRAAAQQNQSTGAPNVVTLNISSGTPGAPGGNNWGGGQWGGGGGQWGGGGWGGGQWGGGGWGGGWGNPQDAVPNDAEPERPITYRGNNLPAELDWFQQLDTDHDGQVGLYEWKASGRPISEFEKRDLNGDGFITAEEIIKYEAKNNPTLRLDQQGNLAQGRGGQRPNFGAGTFGMGGPGGFGQGNQNWRMNFGQGGNNGGPQGGGPGGGFRRNNRPQDGQPQADGGGRQRNRGGNRGGNNRMPQG